LGQLDIPEVFAVADTLSEKIANAGRITISNAGHLVNMTKPVEFNQAVLDFLSKR
jgi:pimeloyl-ACP methyl ester carboxylesterase